MTAGKSASLGRPAEYQNQTGSGVCTEERLASYSGRWMSRGDSGPGTEEAHSLNYLERDANPECQEEGTHATYGEQRKAPTVLGF